MAIKTTIEQLEEVQAQITKVMSGQDVMFGDKRVARASLNALTAREQMLLRRYKSEQKTGGLCVNIGQTRR